MLLYQKDCMLQDRKAKTISVFNFKCDHNRKEIYILNTFKMSDCCNLNLLYNFYCDCSNLSYLDFSSITRLPFGSELLSTFCSSNEAVCLFLNLIGFESTKSANIINMMICEIPKPA